MVFKKHPSAEVRAESAERELTRVKHGAINSNFVQVSKVYIDEMKELARNAPSAHTVLWTLIQEMNKQNSIMISVPSLAKLLGMSPATIKRGIQLLRDQQWIEVLKIGTSNVYRVNASVVWQNRADTKWAAFDARLVVNWDEQDEATKRAPRVNTRHIPLVLADDLTTLDVESSFKEQESLPARGQGELGLT
ncbi:helix-turn-helix domain-containing protein [Massilia sp. P8910]|uniref:replication/maintenance protein RepL n=1 Tax=Massilia antarctica TaxID=2765360 RepID=UPI001E3B1E84|nr:replication/maintenance protein RepL [Massilia antarctica]MCE3602750.1 helix-turn-helix domain-containing protein [Massilia antarctica]